MSEEIARLIERTDKTLATLEDAEVERLNSALNSSYDDFERRLLEKYPNYTGEAKPGLIATQRGVLLLQELRSVIPLLNRSKEQEYEQRYQKVLGTASQEGVTLADELARLRRGDEFVQASATIPIEAAAAAARGVVQNLKRYDTEFQNEASVIITQGLIQGWGAMRTAQQLRSRLGVAKGKAEMLARTEIIRAQDTATRSRYKEAGIAYYQRVATQDPNVCGWCSERAGKVYPVDVPIHLHPRDRCVAVAWMPEWEESDSIDNEWIERHVEDVRSQVAELRTDAAPFERLAGAIARPVWTPDDGYTDPGVRDNGQNWAIALLALALIVGGRQPDQPDEPAPPDEENQLLKALVIGAAIVGVSLTTYYLARARYRAGFKESARMANAMAADFDRLTDDLAPADKNQVTIAAGGFGGMQGRAGIEHASYYEEFLDDHLLVGVATPEFDKGPAIEKDPLGHVASNYSTVLGTALIDGRNMSAVRMAAMAAAYYRKHGKPINLIGYSGGGMVAAEANEILKEMGIPAKSVSIGTPWFGFTDLSPNEHMGLMGGGDVFRPLPTQNGFLLDDVASHMLGDYRKSPQFADAIRNFLGVQSQTPGADLVHVPTVDGELIDNTIADLTPQLLLLSEEELKALPEPIADRLIGLRRSLGMALGRADSKALPGVPQPQALPGYKPILALPEAREARVSLRGKLQPIQIPPRQLAPVTRQQRTNLEQRTARAIYQQTRSQERERARESEQRIREAIAQIQQQDLPMLPKLEAMRNAMFEQLSAISEGVSQTQAPGTAEAEDFTSFLFGGIRWYVPGELKATSPALDLVRKFAVLDLPDEMLRHVNDIYISRQPSNQEKFWRKKLKLITPQVPAFVRMEDRAIVFFRGRGKDEELLRQMAYALAYSRFGQLAPLEGSDYWRATQGERPSTAYAMRGPAQDFADSVKEYFLNRKHLKRFAPQRHAAIARLFGDLE